jgi:hypothetical protein
MTWLARAIALSTPKLNTPRGAAPGSFICARRAGIGTWYWEEALTREVGAVRREPVHQSKHRRSELNACLAGRSVRRQSEVGHVNEEDEQLAHWKEPVGRRQPGRKLAMMCDPVRRYSIEIKEVDAGLLRLVKCFPQLGTPRRDLRHETDPAELA